MSHGLTVVHGHSISDGGPAFRSNRIGIDTGAYRTDRLTALGIENNETWTLDTTTWPAFLSKDTTFGRLHRQDLPRAGRQGYGTPAGDE
jgi:serine/threonine protein phosphatase 1